MHYTHRGGASVTETITSVYGCSLLEIPEPPGYRIMLKFRPPRAGELYLHPNGVDICLAEADHLGWMPRLILERLER